MALSEITRSLPKLNGVAGFVMLVFVALMVLEPDMMRRAVLLVPIVIFYVLSRVLMAMDQTNIAQEILRRERK